MSPGVDDHPNFDQVCADVRLVVAVSAADDVHNSWHMVKFIEEEAGAAKEMVNPDQVILDIELPFVDLVDVVLGEAGLYQHLVKS